jgi:tRNA threonylcarbamoyladenosine biosynthesis protein TsaB
MSTILAIDTSSERGSVALLREGSPLIVRKAAARETYSTLLFRWLEELEGRVHGGFAKLDGAAVAVGPGSFTGLRIGVAAAKGIALASGCLIFQFSTLAAMSFAFGKGPELRRPLLAAGRGEVYTALYRVDGSGVTLEEAEAVVQPRELKPAGDEKVLVFGNGTALCREALSTFPEGSIEISDRHPALAPAMAEAALKRLRAGRGITPDAVRMNYIRLSDAEQARPQRTTSNAQESA